MSSSAASIAWKSIVVAVVVLALKALAAWLSGSVALLSDAVESVVNVATALAAWIGILYASRPADDDHPYGHEKAEYFVALFEAVMIGAAAWSIIAAALDAIRHGRELNVPLEAYLANIAAGLINGSWCYVLISRGKRLKSAALQSDGWHLFADVVSSVGVLAGVFLASITGISILDPLLAIVVAGNILWSGWRLLKMSVGGLMDVAPDPDTQKLIERSIEAAGGGAMQAHDLKARISGPTTFIEFHLIVSGAMTVSKAHEICDRIEAAIRKEIPRTRISIHVEPENKAHFHGGIDL
ncbi:MAG: cation diffusion facilitator family transporter [Salaquimonas sp.]|nr:cation diffusion facilitator family transporter [Salaquimonas sp.]